MTEWHIFTKDGEDYTGESLKYEENCMVLFRRRQRRMITEKLDWETLWLSHKEIIWYEDVEIYDYIIPILEVKRVERWDVSAETKKGQNSEEGEDEMLVP